MSGTTDAAIPTADADPIETTSWYWVAAVPLSIPVSLLLAVVISVIFGQQSQMASLAFAPMVLVLLPWVFGLRNDIRAVNQADVEWQPGILPYFALSIVLTPYIGAVIYMIQRYRLIGLRSLS